MRAPAYCCISLARSCIVGLRGGRRDRVGFTDDDAAAVSSTARFGLDGCDDTDSTVLLVGLPTFICCESNMARSFMDGT